MHPASPPILSRVHNADPDRFRAALAAPSPLRERLMALYAFNLEIARIDGAATEPLIARMRRQFWRDAVAAASQGGDPPAHPTAEALVEALSPAPEAIAALLIRLIDAREAVAEEGIAAQGAAFFEATGGGLMRAAALASEAPEAEDAAGDAGFALGAANALKAFPAMAVQGRSLLPSAPLDPARLRRGEPWPELLQAINAFARGAEARLDRAKQARRKTRRARAAFLTAWDARRVLRLAQRPGLDPFRDLTERSEFARRFQPLWRSVAGGWW